MGRHRTIIKLALLAIFIALLYRAAIELGRI